MRSAECGIGTRAEAARTHSPVRSGQRSRGGGELLGAPPLITHSGARAVPTEPIPHSALRIRKGWHEHDNHSAGGGAADARVLARGGGGAGAREGRAGLGARGATE